jgi:hypothetical protein
VTFLLVLVVRGGRGSRGPLCEAMAVLPDDEFVLACARDVGIGLRYP